jgi:hypothetical protein
VKARIDKIAAVQSELRYFLEAAQETMKRQFDQGTRLTPAWNVGDKVWLNSKNIATTRPSPKLDHRWLGPYPIAAKISPSVYKLTLPIAMKAAHPVFHFSIMKKNKPDKIVGRRRQPPTPIEVKGEEEWEVEEVLDCRKKGKTKEYLISWKEFGEQENSWEPASNINNCQELIKEFESRFLDAASRYKRSRRK